MPDTSIFRDYVKELLAAVSLGNATEHTHRPALQTLLESAADGIVATNEPKRVECGAPDYSISRKRDGLTVGYVEAKDIGANLADIERDSNRKNPSTANGRQFKRYRESLPNLLLTRLRRVPLVRGRAASRHCHPCGAGCQRQANAAEKWNSRN